MMRNPDIHAKDLKNQHRKTVNGYPVVDVIKILEMHGYVVIHRSQVPGSLNKDIKDKAA
ncbi:hypothetical protein [Bradyrhizobium elkanii]|uniref:Uncharacterized protein n=1 Tax=Bradyrhizobium elkanii TaxID=29448 RepID=A0ABV4F0B7_BRAEL|nr:hypothetical protein [Bradyrhizobium elkanii]MCP1757885.1 hypothetical protein [Bradyrhizobium elkanii]MCS3881818.1 hypothetical protein [Bradyrhizobium elkanii]MCS4218577.1 hypothetical protein [Bradyrhizobium elkanii]MCW2110126.1 hypothetical protein [Bradyrhizobium elkanii]MCW2201505.1 hypothetical protein [Bradyrhizobium elkanii]